MAALIHAARVIDANFAFQPGLSDKPLENGVNVKRPVERTRLSAGAHEHVMSVLAHRTKMNDWCAG
jgi:hypothetical protein